MSVNRSPLGTSHPPHWAEGLAGRGGGGPQPLGGGGHGATESVSVGSDCGTCRPSIHALFEVFDQS